MSELKAIIGHEDIQKKLLVLTQSEKLPHAFLFHGAKGIGKRLVAETFGQYLLCGPLEKGTQKLSINKSHILYPQIMAGACADYVILTPEEAKKSISVEQIRKLQEQLSLSAEQQRVVIIDSADCLTNNAANALLKTLEEPGKGVHLVLLAHNPSRLLPTIISRCRQFRFTPLTEPQIEQILAEHEDGKEALSFTAYCQGSAGEAIHMATQIQGLQQELIDFTRQGKNLPYHSATQIAERLHRKKAIPAGMNILLALMAQHARAEKPYSWSSLYNKTAVRIKEMNEFNINPQLTMEATLIDIKEAAHTEN